MDQINLEKLGIPTVTVATSQFKDLARVVAVAEGAAGLRFVVVPHPIGMMPRAEVEKKAEDIFSEILEVVVGKQTPAKLPLQRPAYPAERIQFTGTNTNVNRLFFEKGWSMGLPIIPPTPELVKEMLRGTTRKPDEVIGEVPPQMGTLTIELVAVHAVMAGCKPEYMPLLIAAIEGLLTPEVDWRAALATTASPVFVIIVNGPIIKELGLSNDQGAGGKGYHPNASVSYAISLIAYAVGGSKSPSPDKSTLGSPGDFVGWIFGENEDRLPPGWEPMHVERGFNKSDNVVTVMITEPAVDNKDHFSVSVEEHIRWWKYLISPLMNVGGPGIPSALDAFPLIAISPEHAQLIASAGWVKNAFRQALWEQARIPLSAWPAGCIHTGKISKYFGSVNPKSMIPITLKPEQFNIVIAGGAGKHSYYFAPFPGALPVSKLVR